MSCYSVAVLQAKIEARYVEELLASEPGLRALVQALTPVLKAEPSLTIYGDQAILTVPGGPQIILDRLGLRVSARSMRAFEQEQLTITVGEIAQKLAIPLAQERIVQGLRARYGQYAVTSDQAVGAARVVKLQIPL